MRSLLLLALVIPAAASAQARQLRAIPDESFDASALELSSPPSIRVDRQNRAFVADRDGKRMVRLSADGRQFDQIVREGAGPGEAKGFISLAWKADTLWFFDNWQARFTLLDAEGKFLKTLAMNDRCNSFGSYLMTGDGCLEYMQPSGQNGPPSLAAPQPVLVTSQQKKRADTLGMMSRAHTVMLFRGEGRMSYGTQPFPDDATISPALNGTAALELRRAAATSSRTDSIMLRLWSPGTGWGGWAAIHYQPRPLEGRVIDSVLAEQAARLKKSNPWVTLDSLESQVYRPRFHPPAPQVLSTSDGTLWIRVVDARTPPGTYSWVVFDDRLAEKARVAVPARFQVLDARGDYAWGIELDPDDVPVVVRYKLVAAK